MRVRIGEVLTVNYRVTNQTARATTGQASYNVSPPTVGAYFSKINCFCFTEQRLEPGETRDMPVVFYVDPALAQDAEQARLDVITLSYTFFCAARPACTGRRRCQPTPAGRLVIRTETMMADAHAKPNHDYHLVDPSPWPAVGAASAFLMAVGAIFWMHKSFAAAPVIFGVGVIGVLYTLIAWWRDVIREAEYRRLPHPRGADLAPLRDDPVHRLRGDVLRRLVLGLFQHRAVSRPTRTIFARIAATGGVWPPKGIETFDPWHLPLLNTLILLTSGTTVTWAHHALLENDRKGLKWGLILTIVLGALFTCVQAYEYRHAAFGFKGNIYGATFFMATGFHGAHVIIGTIFLIVCLVARLNGHFTPKQHLGFEFAAWYWHFVDVVWLFLFVCIYVWGCGPDTPEPARIERRPTGTSRRAASRPPFSFVAGAMSDAMSDAPIWPVGHARLARPLSALRRGPAVSWLSVAAAAMRKLRARLSLRRYRRRAGGVRHFWSRASSWCSPRLSSRSCMAAVLAACGAVAAADPAHDAAPLRHQGSADRAAVPPQGGRKGGSRQREPGRDSRSAVTASGVLRRIGFAVLCRPRHLAARAQGLEGRADRHARARAAPLPSRLPLPALAASIHGDDEFRRVASARNSCPGKEALVYTPRLGVARRCVGPRLLGVRAGEARERRHRRRQPRLCRRRAHAGNVGRSAVGRRRDRRRAALAGGARRTSRPPMTGQQCLVRARSSLRSPPPRAGARSRRSMSSRKPAAPARRGRPAAVSLPNNHLQYASPGRLRRLAIFRLVRAVARVS